MSSLRRAVLTGAALLTVWVDGAAAATAPSLRPAGLQPDANSSEGGLWSLSEKAEIHVRNSAELNRDPALTAFVRGVMCKLAAEYCDELRVYVLDRPVLNAAAAPNGYVEVNSGLLLRARTEDELAFVLGHEVSHFGRNHTLENWKTTKGTANAMLVLSIGVGAAAAAASYSAASSGAPNAGQTINSISAAAQSVNDLIYLAGMATIFSFSREEESEADRLGFDRAKAAGYDTGGGVVMWSDVIAESQASDFPKVRASEARASMFRTHPVNAERISVLKALGGDPGATDQAAETRYRAVIRPHLAAWLKDDLRRRDYGQSLHLIDRLKGQGEDLGVLNYYRGEAYRQRRADGDLLHAAAAYREAVAHDDAPGVAWRELGEALRKSGDKAQARLAFETYLAREPTAEDRWLVEQTLQSMPTGG